VTSPDRFAAYERLVREASTRLDLVSPKDLDRFHERHIGDSLKALPWLDAAPEGPAVDVGSGAGLPGIPLALARPERHWRLLEPRRLRAAFLERCVRDLELDCEVLVTTAEQAALDPALARGHILATARALAPPQDAFPLLTPLLAPGGIAVLWVGRDATIPPEAEVSAVGLATLRV
jgi:16S rRNA (guanine527-N7)-methyltransferase